MAAQYAKTVDGLEDDARALEARVQAGTLPRAALELLAGVDDRVAERALRRLPLVLTTAAPEVRPEAGAPPHAEGWLRWATQLEVFDRSLAARLVLAACDVARGALVEEEPGMRSELVGLHTGPWGVLVVTPAIAATLAPFKALAARTSDAVRQWLEEPTPAAQRAILAAWPEPMWTRSRVELLAQLGDVDPHALWALRWLVVLVTDSDTSVGVAAGGALIDAESACGARGPIADAVRAALRDAWVDG